MDVVIQRYYNKKDAVGLSWGFVTIPHFCMTYFMNAPKTVCILILSCCRKNINEKDGKDSQLLESKNETNSSKHVTEKMEVS